MDNLTKFSQKVICCLYNMYLDRKKSGMSKSSAIEFEDNFFLNDKLLSSCLVADINSALSELREKKYIRMNICGDVFLLDSTIIYMENRFKNGAIDIIKFITNII